MGSTVRAGPVKLYTNDKSDAFVALYTNYGVEKSKYIFFVRTLCQDHGPDITCVCTHYQDHGPDGTSMYAIIRSIIRVVI